MAGLLAEGVSKAEVASLQLLFSANPNVSVASVIKIARDKRNDPAIAPVLKFLKETLLPKKQTTKEDGTYNSEEEKALEAAEKVRALTASKLLYESSAIAHVLHQSIVPGSTNFKQEVQSAQERYERDLGRKLNDDEKFE